MLGHTGGDEFMIFLPHTDAKAADQLKADIKNSIESYNRVNDNALYAISVSIGHSTKNGEDQEMQTVMVGADEYMRRRKMLNQNSSHSAIVSSRMAALYAKSQETQEHERWDGTGYPKGLKGDETPALSRILSIADAFDAMTEDRVYRGALSKKRGNKRN